MVEGIDWTAIDAANLLYLDGIIDGDEQERAYVAAVGDERLAFGLLGTVLRAIGE